MKRTIWIDDPHNDGCGVCITVKSRTMLDSWCNVLDMFDAEYEVSVDDEIAMKAEEVYARLTYR